jgi:hypothetical protein
MFTFKTNELVELTREELQDVRGGTSVEYTLTVTDTETGMTKATPKLFLHCASGSH